MDSRLILGFLGVIVGLFPGATGQGQLPTLQEQEKIMEETAQQIIKAFPEEVQGNPRIAEIVRDSLRQANASAATPDMAKLLIYSNTGWSATVLDSGLDSFTQD